MEITKKELIDLFETFLNENGLWYTFADFVEEQGYTTTELGFPED